jgi:hypothetical protein
MTGSGNTPQTMATPYLISSCALPGERTWSAFGTDRAGNSSSSISRQLEYNPAIPTINAVNIVPNYAAGSALELDVLAGDDEDLMSYEMWAHHTTNVGNDIVVKFGPLGGFGNVWGSDWDSSLYLLTTLGTDSRVGIPAAYSLNAYVESAAATGATAVLDTLTVLVYDTFGATDNGVAPGDTNQIALNPAFVVASSYGLANSFGSIIPGVLTPTLLSPTASSCAFDYSTPTNNPQILMRIWAMNDADPANPNTAGGGAAGSYTVLVDISAAPALLSDNGIQRLYRQTISSSMSCTAAGWGITGGVNNIFVINANQAWEVY